VERSRSFTRACDDCLSGEGGGVLELLCGAGRGARLGISRVLDDFFEDLAKREGRTMPDGGMSLEFSVGCWVIPGSIKMSWDFAPKDVARTFYTDEDNPASRAVRNVHCEGWGSPANANQALHHALVGPNNKPLPYLGLAYTLSWHHCLTRTISSKLCARRIFFLMAAWIRVGSPASLISDGDLQARPVWGHGTWLRRPWRQRRVAPFGPQKKRDETTKQASHLSVVVAPSNTRRRHTPHMPGKTCPEATRATRPGVAVYVVQQRPVPCIRQASVFQCGF